MSSIFEALGMNSAVRGRPRTDAVAPFSHELIELRLVLGLPQATQKILKLVLFVLKAPQGFGPVVVEGLVA